MTEAVPATGAQERPSSVGVSPDASRQTRFASPRRFSSGVLLVALLYAVVWAAGMAYHQQAPSLDNAEQLAWAYALEAGFWKHPPLPSWIMHALVRAFGPSVGLPLFAAQVSIALALFLSWRLGSEFMGQQRSLLAAALTSLVGYYGWSADAYNHNSALLPFQAGMTLCFYLALRRRQWRFWALTGVFSGLALLVKYVALLPLASCLLYVALDRQAWTRRTAVGVALAAAIAGVLVAPHLMWLVSHDAMPIVYARSAAAPLPNVWAWFVNVKDFLQAQFWTLLPLVVVASWMAVGLRLRPAGRVPTSPEPDRLFLWTIGMAPLGLVILSGAVTGTQIQARWGYNAFLLAGWLVVDGLRWPTRWDRQALRACATAQLILWCTVVAGLPAAARLAGWQGRSTFPGSAFARAAQDTWREQTGQPLRLVVSDVWLGGTLAAFHGAPLAVLVDGDWARAAWVTKQDLHDCGALVVRGDEVHGQRSMPGVSRFMGQAVERGDWELQWAPSRDAGRGAGTTSHIAWGIIPPQDAANCRL